MDKIDELNSKIANFQSELSTIESKSESDLWQEDIGMIEEGLKKITVQVSKEKIKFQIKKKTK